MFSHHHLQPYATAYHQGVTLNTCNPASQAEPRPPGAPAVDLGRVQAAAEAEAAQAAELAEAQRLANAAKATLPVPFRPDGPPLGFIFEAAPGKDVEIISEHFRFSNNSLNDLVASDNLHFDAAPGTAKPAPLLVVLRAACVSACVPSASRIGTCDSISRPGS